MKKNPLSIFSLLISLVLVGCTKPDVSSSINESVDPTSESIEIPTSEPEYYRAMYNNPLHIYDNNGDKYFVPIADPDVIYGEDGFWYMYPTNAPVKNNEGVDIFDYGPIFRSNDLISWTWIGSVFLGHPDATSWGTPGAGVWAPSVIKVGNKWNYYYSLSTWGDSNPGVGVATSSTPYGPWTHHGRVIDSTTSGVRNSIDPQAIYDGESLYLLWGSFFGVAGILLTDDGIEPYYGELYPDYLKWLIPDNTSEGMNIDINYEGTYVIKRNGKYYFMGSQGTCCSGVSSTYRVKVGVSDTLFGPYVASTGEELSKEPYGDLVIGPTEDIAGTGHHTIIQDFAGDYWIIYHGFDIHGERPNERELMIDRLLFDAETGMPYVENYVPTYGLEKEGPLVIKI